MEEINFNITGNNNQVLLKIEETRKAFGELGSCLEQQERKAEKLFKQMVLGLDGIEVSLKTIHGQVGDTFGLLNKLSSGSRLQVEKLQEALERLNSLKKGSLESGDDAENNKRSSQLLAINTEIAARKALIAEIQDQYDELTELDKELANYQAELERLKELQSAFRLDGSASNAELLQKSNSGIEYPGGNTQMSGRMVGSSSVAGEAGAQPSGLSSLNAGLEGVKSGLDGLDGTFTAVTGTMKLFSLENETLQRIMGKVQTAISITNALQAVSATLDQNSAFQINVLGKLKQWWRGITLQAAAAQGLETAAASTGAVVNLGLAGSFRAMGLAIKSIPVFGWIAAGISALIEVYSIWSSKNKEQEEARNAAVEATKRQAEEEELLRKSVAGAVVPQIVEYKKLQAAYNALGDDMEKKKAFINDNAEAFKKLNVSVSNVEQAENLLVSNETAFLASLTKRAVASASMEVAADKYKKAVEKMIEAEGYQPTAEDKAYATQEADKWLVEQASKAGSRGNIKNLATKPEYADSKDAWTQSIRQGYQNAYKRNLDSIVEPMKAFTQNDAKALVESANNDVKTGMKLAGTADNILETANIKPYNDGGRQGSNEKSKQAQRQKDLQEQQAKLNELLDRQAVDNQRRAKERQNLNSQAEIDADDKEASRKRRQLEFNQQKELQQLEQEKKETLNQKIRDAREIFNAEQDLAVKQDPKHKRGTFDASTVKLSESEERGYDKRKTNILKKQENELAAYAAEQKAAMGEALIQYGTYMEKRQAISDIGKAKKNGKGIEEQKAIDQQTQKTLYELEVAVQKETSVFGKLFSDMKDRSVKDMSAITEQAEEALAFVEGGEWNEEQGLKLGISKETFDYLKNTPEELDKVKQGIKDTKAEVANFDNAFTKMAGGFKKVFEEGGDPKKLQEGLAQIESAMNEVMAAGKFLSNSLSSLGDAFGSDTLKGIAEGMNAVMDAASATMDGAKAGAAFGPWGAAAGAAIGLATSLASSIAKIHDAKNEKRIQVLQEQIDTLNKSYEKLGDSVEKAYSSDASQLIEQQNQLLEQQKLLIRNQIMEEQSKKNADDGRIKEWQNQIDEINKTLEENKEKQIDVIFGEDVKAAIDNFAQAYADAWAAGDDKAKSSKDFVKNMIKQMVMESIKAASSKPMEELRKKLAGFFSDGIISAWEQGQIEEDAARLMSELDGKFAWADRFMKDDEAEGDSTREASQKGIAQASQESVDKLDGVMTNIQGHTYSINDNVRAILETMKGTATPGIQGSEKATGFSNHTVSLADIDRNMSSMIGLGSTAVSHLSSIADNTARLMTIEQTMSSIKTGIDTMNTKGITIKR